MTKLITAILHIPMLMVYSAEGFLNSFMFIVGYGFGDEKIEYDIEFEPQNVIAHSIRWFVLLYFIFTYGLLGIFVYISLAMALDMLCLLTMKIADILIDKFG